MACVCSLQASNTIKLHMVNTAQERDAAIDELKRMKKELHKKDRARDQVKYTADIHIIS